MRIEGLLLDGGRAASVETDGPRIARIVELEQAPQRWIAPGLLDLQVNGFAGHDVNADDVSPETIALLARAMWRLGVTAFCPTVITGPEARMVRAFEAIAQACRTDPLVARAIPCVHAEGPFISPEDGPRGAHPLEHVRPPSFAELQRWQAAADGWLGMITLAPELPGASELIQRADSAGVLVAIGHTAAQAGQIRAAVDAGARLSTHLGNGAHAVLPRHPNYIWEQLAEDRLTASLIFDGHHLPPAVMRTMLRAKGLERVVLVSDVTAVGGLAPGTYQTPVGGRVELLADGRLTLPGTTYLAGAASPLPRGLANAVRWGGLGLGAAVGLASTNPARLLGLDRSGHGLLQVGAAADLTVFRFSPGEADLAVELTVVGGEVVYAAEGGPG